MPGRGAPGRGCTGAPPLRGRGTICGQGAPRLRPVPLAGAPGTLAEWTLSATVGAGGGAVALQSNQRLPVRKGSAGWETVIMEGDDSLTGDLDLSGEWYEHEVWGSMLHYESLQRYYTFVGERLARRRRWFASLLLTASSGAAATLLAGLPLTVSQALALLVVALTVWTELADYKGKSARSLEVATKLGHLAAEMRALWLDLPQIDARAARSAWRDLEARATEATRHIPAGLLGHHSLQDRAEDETYSYWSARSGTALANA